MITTKDLTYQYPQSSKISFPNITVHPGKALLITGESGCGKTTLLHLLSGLRNPLSGQIKIGESAITNFTPAKMDQFRGSHIGMVFQNAHFIESLKLIENLLLSPFVKSREKAEKVAKRLQIEEFLNRYPRELSVGQQQRVNIARAVMNEPQLILADEPTSALDNKNCTKVIDLLIDEAQKNNAALIVVTHDDRVRAEIKETLELAPLVL
ncbi:MAG: ATP-binding cassette domain-containing protein [Bacteroidota bacterium]